MISEADVNSNFFVGQIPQASPGISGKLISKCRKLRLSYMANPEKMSGSPCVYKIGSQVYMMRWFGTVPGDHIPEQDWQNAYFVRRREVPLEDEKVQEALAASFVLLRMDQKKARLDDYYNVYSNMSSAYISSSSPYGTSTSYWGGPSTYTVTSSNTYPAIAQQQYQSYAQLPGGGWSAVKKMLGIP